MLQKERERERERRGQNWIYFSKSGQLEGGFVEAKRETDVMVERSGSYETMYNFLSHCVTVEL